MDRRAFVKLSGASALRLQSIARDEQSTEPKPQPPSALVPQQWQARWIWYPGQLAAHRHRRRMQATLARCTNVGYPGNFRQPASETFFRLQRSVTTVQNARWQAPPSRARVLLGTRGADLAVTSGQLRPGDTSIFAHIDFADTLPCFLLETPTLATGPAWEVSLDGASWVPAECGTYCDPLVRPDDDQERIVAIFAASTAVPAGPSRARYDLLPNTPCVLDFLETELGVLRFQASGSGTLSVGVGESVAEALGAADTANLEQYALAPVQLLQQPVTSRLPERAFRYAAFTSTRAAFLRDVAFDTKQWRATERGTFECSDPSLNAIWRTAVATLRSNMHDFYLDGIRRDALLWHDGPLTLPAYDRVFGDADLSRQTLVGETLPVNPTVADVGILDSPMYALTGFLNEYMHRGDASFSRMYRERIEELTNFLIRLQNADGFISGEPVQPYGFFPDWSANAKSGPDSHGIPAYSQMLLHGAFSAAATLAAAWGDDRLSKSLQERAYRLRSRIRSIFFDKKQGLFINGLTRTGEVDLRLTSFAQAFAIEFGVAEPSEYQALFVFLNDYNRRPDRFSLSQVVELTAYARAGRAEDGIRRLKLGWLPWIEAGYRRFPEDIQPGKPPAEQLGMYGRKYAASLCHAWAGAAPVMLLSRGVLGISAKQPGYTQCAIAPQRCGLEWGRGSVACPGGSIGVAWQGNQGKATLPDDVTATLADGSVHTGPGTFPFLLN